ncbi:MAG: sulfurtransferase [Planctomycetia bacterium]|nr:sulfurtransferase [Planctomycetia bacterium]
MIGSLSLSLALLGAMFAQAPSNDYVNPELLVEPAALRLGDFVVLDARPREQYLAGHVPGARWIDAGEWAKGFDQGQDVAGWQQRIGALGLTTSDKLVIYDDNQTKDAARMWWILRYLDVADVRLLNGGWKGWQAAKREIETAPAPEPKATEPELRPIADRLATKEGLLHSLETGDLQIIDTRSDAEFCGDDALKNKRAGAIPGAKHLEWVDLLNADTGRFREASELSQLFAKSGIDLQRPAATHCQSGGRASVMVFGMELMGAKHVSNYYRSWQEWGNADDTPIVKGEKQE